MILQLLFCFILFHHRTWAIWFSYVKKLSQTNWPRQRVFVSIIFLNILHYHWYDNSYNISYYFYIIHLKKCCARSWCRIRARLLFCLEKYQASQVDAKTKSDVHHEGSKMRSGKVNRSWAKQLCGTSQASVLQGISGLVDVDMCSRDLFFPQRKWGPSALNDCNGKHGIFIHVTSTCFLHFERQDSSSWLRLQCVTSST